MVDDMSLWSDLQEVRRLAVGGFFLAGTAGLVGIVFAVSGATGASALIGAGAFFTLIRSAASACIARGRRAPPERPANPGDGSWRARVAADYAAARAARCAARCADTAAQHPADAGAGAGAGSGRDPADNAPLPYPVLLVPAVVAVCAYACGLVAIIGGATADDPVLGGFGGAAGFGAVAGAAVIEIVVVSTFVGKIRKAVA